MSTGTPHGREVDHEAAATAFVERVRERDVEGLERLYLFGSVVRGEEGGLDSDIDVLAVIGDDADPGTVREELGALSYDVMLSFGPVVEVHVVPAARFDHRVEAGFPFERRVAAEGERVV